MIVIDQLSMITPGKMPGAYERATEISNRLRRLALDLHVPIVVACQINRRGSQTTNTSATLNDLRDSGCIENDAASVLILGKTKPAKDTSAGELVQTLPVSVAKNRYGEATPTNNPIRLVWRPEWCRIDDPGSGAVG